ncbi:hypothetical protein SHIRM173S_04486 [Streptomyces hirsutus]
MIEGEVRADRFRTDFLSLCQAVTGRIRAGEVRRHPLRRPTAPGMLGTVGQETRYAGHDRALHTADSGAA